MDLHRIVSVIRQCGRLRAFRHGRSLHAHIIKLGVFNDVFFANNLLAMYVDISLLKDARRLFDETLERNVATWTTMISAYSSSGRPDTALKFYVQMLESKSETPNGFLYSAVLKACGLVGDLESGKLIHGRVFRANLGFDTVLMNTLLDMYVKCGSLSSARKVFDDILCPSSTSWNTMISGYGKEGLMEEAVNLFYQMPEPDTVSWNSIIAGFGCKESLGALRFVCMMHRKGLKLDGFTFSCALKTCGCFQLLVMVKQIHCYVNKSGFGSCCFTASALVDSYSNCNELDEAIKMFDEYSCCSASILDCLPLWNSMLSGYVVNEQNSAAINLVSQIYSLGAHVDSFTFGSALKVCINLQNFRLGLQVQGLAVTSGYELDYVVGSILIDLYANDGKIKDALRLFHRLPEKDIVVWSSLISWYTKMGLNSLVFSLFRDMVNLDIEVDQFIISSVLKACSSLVGLGSGKQVHSFCVKSGYESERITVTSLIDLYAKCGEIEDGLALFYCTSERDTVCYTGIIMGCGQNGRAMEAVGFFQEMIELGLKPNEITFLGVLSACRHAGLVEEAWTIFKYMKTEYKMEPHIEHYYCIVELLSQAGCFKEAEELIAEMPFEPDQTIWNSLLGACGTHKKTELVNFIAERLLTTLPEDPSILVTLSNVYATLEMWDDSRKMREVIKKVDMKEAGKSWIQIKS